MYPAEFEYYRAQNIEEAINLMKEHAGAKLLAGGHSLIPMMKLRLAQPPALVDIGSISELSGVQENGDRLRIGSLTTHADLAKSEVLWDHCPILAEAASQIADPQVRNKGTIGGNLAHADPGSDLPAVIQALEGTLFMSGPDGERRSSASDFFLDLLVTDLRPEEIITAIEVAALGAGTGSAYLKFEHPASGYAICGAAALVELDDQGACRKAKLCLNGVAVIPHQVDLTDSLSGSSLDEQAIQDAVNQDLQIEEPMGDSFASGAYRVEMARVYARRALKQASDRARS